jgi:hypothetical protein
MPSPFPGMNPYLEQDDVWHDFHERFIPAAAADLEEQVGPEYIVKIDQHRYIHEQDEPRRFLGRPDLYVAEQGCDLLERVQSLSGSLFVHRLQRPGFMLEKTDELR